MKNHDKNQFEDPNGISSNIVLNDVYEKFKQDSIYDVPLCGGRFSIKNNEERVMLESFDDAFDDLFTTECGEDDMSLDVALLELRNFMSLSDDCYEDSECPKQEDGCRTAEFNQTDSVFCEKEQQGEYLRIPSLKIDVKGVKKVHKCMAKFERRSDRTKH